MLDVCFVLNGTCPNLDRTRCDECELHKVYTRFKQDSRLIETLGEAAYKKKKGGKNGNS